jgi:hypothetical protein
MMPSSSKKQHNFMEAIAHNKAFANKVHIPQSVGRDFVEADKGKHFRKGGTMAKTKPVNPAMAMMAARAMRTPQATAPVNPMAGAAPAPGAMPGMKHGGLSKEHHKHLAHHHLSMAEHHMAQHEGHHGMKKMAKGGHTSEKKHEMRQAHELEKLAKEERHEAKMMKHGGKMHKYAAGGSIPGEKSYKHKETMGPRNMSQDVEKGSNKDIKHGEHAIQKRGHTRDMHPKMAGNTIGTGKEVNIKKHGGHIKKMASGGSTSARADGIAKRGRTNTKYC